MMSLDDALFSSLRLLTARSYLSSCPCSCVSHSRVVHVPWSGRVPKASCRSS
uniref:Uncharacterized protein n=1 Tax=Anguilla anguilla TaxID=7936 RepID=A0A0E9V6C3_ANGAN